MAKDKKKDKKAKKIEEEQLKKISSNKILIRVFKDFGSNTAILKAEYEAEERRDAYNNLVAINKQFLHDEDTDFTIDDVYHDMQVLLEFKNKDKESKIKMLKEKIKFQEQLIKYLDQFPELNAVYNYADENLKLHDYRLLMEYTTHITGEGAYFTIEKGMRVYSFDSVDGFLVPIWRGVATHSQYPDHTRKKKIVIQEDIILKQELQKYNVNKKLGNLLIWGIIAITILFALNLWGGLKLLEMHQTMDKELHGASFQCAEYTSRLHQLYAQALQTNLFPPEQAEQIQAQLKTLEPDKVG